MNVRWWLEPSHVRKKENHTLIVPAAAVVARPLHAERRGSAEQPIGLVCVAEEFQQVLCLSERALESVVAAIGLCVHKDLSGWYKEMTGEETSVCVRAPRARAPRG